MGKTSSEGKVVGALGIAAGVAAVAAGYYFYGKGGKAHRKQAMDWMEKAKADVLEKIEKMKDVTETTYHKVVDQVLSKYKLVKDIDPVELQNFGKELKAHWAQISKQALKLSAKTVTKKSTAKV
jgi:hypothetical protein